MPVVLDARARPDGAGDPAPGARREGARRGRPLSRDADRAGSDAAPEPVGRRDAAPGSTAGATIHAPDREAGGVLVIGYGNTLRADDGVGVHAARALADDPRLAGARVVACHQLTPELAVDLAAASLVVLVDATVEAEPGQLLLRRPPDEASLLRAAAAGPGATSHHVGAEELLGLAAELYGAAPEIVVVSVGVATMEAGEELSPAVAAALPGVVDAVIGLLAGHPRG